MKARTAAALVLLGALAAGCGAGDDKAPSSKQTGSPSSSSPPSPALEDLQAVCPKVEAALPAGMLVPSPEQLVQIHNEVMAIEAGADLEAKNALELFMRGMTDAVNAYNDASDPAPGLTVSQAFDDGLSAFAERCKAAGSSALQ